MLSHVCFISQAYFFLTCTPPLVPASLSLRLTLHTPGLGCRMEPGIRAGSELGKCWSHPALSPTARLMLQGRSISSCR